MALLAVLVVAFLFYSKNQVLVSNQSFSLVQTPEAAEVATAIVLGDLRQEILAGSIKPDPKRVAPDLVASVLYPAAPQSMVPDRTTVTSDKSPDGSAPPNLVKQSQYDRDFYSSQAKSAAGVPLYPRAADFPVLRRASTLSTSASRSGSISASKWNRPLLLPRQNPEDPAKTEPLASGSAVVDGVSEEWKWVPPSWVYLLRDGQTPVQLPDNAGVGSVNPVVARFAYQIYDEGGLLDLNVAGYDPTGSTGRFGGQDPELAAARRGSIGYADLREIGLKGEHLAALVQKRNPATLAAVADDRSPYGNRYTHFLLNGKANFGFMRVAGNQDPSSPLVNSAIPSRLALIDYLSKLSKTSDDRAGLIESLQYLTHFSRGLEQPSYVPGYWNYSAQADPSAANFQLPRIVPPAASRGVSRVETPAGAFLDEPAATRDDILYRGPDVIPSRFFSANNPITTGVLPWEMAISNNRGGNDSWGVQKQRGGANNDTRFLQDLINPGFLEVRIQPGVPDNVRRIDRTAFKAGEPLVKKRFPLERLAWITSRGPSAEITPTTDPLYNPDGTREAILQSFGLVWTAGVDGVSFWLYDHGAKGRIRVLEELAQNNPQRRLPREPDFFELLKAAISAGSLAKPAMSTHTVGAPDDPATLNHMKDRRLDFQVLDIGANLIDQYDADSFPTIIKMESPVDVGMPNLPLYVARGVEDLPYFYRFHWRGVRDGGHASTVTTIPPRAIDVTTTLGSYANFSGGCVSIMGFPELWNPHALNGQAGASPREFRIVAASEVPEMLIDPQLAKLPRKGNGLWEEGVRGIGAYNGSPRMAFAFKPIGTFGYTPVVGGSVPSADTNTVANFLGNAAASGDGGGFFNTSAAPVNRNWPSDRPLSYDNTTFSYNWPFSLYSAYASVSGAGINGLWSLFWNNAPFVPLGPRGPTNLHTVEGNLAGNFYINLLPMSRAPLGGLDNVQRVDDAYYPTDAEYGNLPGLPLWLPPGQGGPQVPPPNLWLDQAMGSYAVPYNVPLRPYCPDPTKIFPTANFSIDQLAASANPTSIAPWQAYFFSMVDADGTVPARTVFHTNGSQNRPPGALGASDGGTQHLDAVVDKRGTELLFSLPNASLFREPTTLCQPDMPSGSDLRAGRGNFFSDSSTGYGGFVTDEANRRWVGFSLGEVPAVSLLLSKLSMSALKSAAADSRYPWSSSNATARGAGLIPFDIPMDLNGAAWQMSKPYGVQPDEKTAGWENIAGLDLPPEVKSDPQSYSPSYSARDFFRVRYFLVPTNLAGVGGNRFTVRLQYKSGNAWVTYDEKYMQIYTSDSGRGNVSPVIGVRGVGIAQDVQIWSAPDNGRPNTTIFSPFSPSHGSTPAGSAKSLGWGTSLLTTFDPRTSRFGMPMRAASNREGAVRGSLANYKTLLSGTDDLPSGFQIDGKSNVTDRVGSASFDLQAPGEAKTVSCSLGVPGAWSGWLWGDTNSSIEIAYGVIRGLIQGADPEREYEQWWAVPGNPLFKQPVLNSSDYGWFSRLPGDLMGGAVSLSTPAQIAGRTKSRSRDLNCFFQSGNEWTTADYNAATTKYGSFWNIANGPAPIADSLRLGAFTENIGPSTDNLYAQAYADPDDVIRRASGAFARLNGSYSGIEGLPMGQGATQNAGNRPVVLNRPFRSVAEMGYAFRGTPWKNLSFFSPETGDAALLDVFCLTEAPPYSLPNNSDVESAQPLVAGKVNLNTRQEKVLRAMLAGGAKDELNPLAAGKLTSQEAGLVAQALVRRTTGSQAWYGPLTNVSELAGKVFAKDLSTGDIPASAPVYTSTVPVSRDTPNRNLQATNTTSLSWHFTGFSADLDPTLFVASRDSKNQRFREASIRALVDGGQTRVWNLMVDLIVQTGRIPNGISAMDRFVKEGESRVWVHLAIDRFTGEILDKQYEWVPE
jgi:hypothetical protein